jgi:tetraacyldisaccharide 4'-kinase
MIRAALTPLAWLYGGAAAARRLAYASGWISRRRLGVPVVSVGALAVGGSGKTPVARWLVERLVDQGLRVGVVHGAYGGSSVARVTRLTAASRWEPGVAARFGDEAPLLAGWLPRAIVTCGRDKTAAAELAVSHGAEVVVIDDGFQHLRLERDLELVLLDDDLLPLPAGRGRELGSARRSADLLWRHGRGGLRPDPGEAQVLSRNVATSLIGLDGSDRGGADRLRGVRVFLVAGVAAPAAFDQIVGLAGATVVGRAFVGDHRPLDGRTLRRAARARADLALCTEKDAARMVGDGAASFLTALCCRLEMMQGEGEVLRRLEALRCSVER